MHYNLFLRNNVAMHDNSVNSNELNLLFIVMFKSSTTYYFRESEIDEV